MLNFVSEHVRSYQTPVDEAIPITDDDWVVGDLPNRSHVEPWTPVVIEDDRIRSVAGAVDSELFFRSVTEPATICGIEQSYSTE